MQGDSAFDTSSQENAVSYELYTLSGTFVLLYADCRVL